MLRLIFIFIAYSLLITSAKSETILISTSNSDYQVINVMSDVDIFDIKVEIDSPLIVGVYDNPPIILVRYSVSGNLIAGTPSGFPSFALSREISGVDFYAQGSSLNFEISQSADLSDGVQANELVDNGSILIFNGREIDHGRYHPALLELYADGTGQIQNSNNIVTQEPFLQVDFGSEYINDLNFTAESTTLIKVVEVTPVEEPNHNRGGGGISIIMMFVLSGVVLRKLSR